MARLEFSGTQELMDELFAESERVERLAPQMLREAGEVVVDAWKEAITEAGHAPPGKSRRATGDLLASVKATGVKKKGDGYTPARSTHREKAEGGSGWPRSPLCCTTARAK